MLRVRPRFLGMSTMASHPTTKGNMQQDWDYWAMRSCPEPGLCPSQWRALRSVFELIYDWRESAVLLESSSALTGRRQGIEVEPSLSMQLLLFWWQWSLVTFFHSLCSRYFWTLFSRREEAGTFLPFLPFPFLPKADRNCSTNQVPKLATKSFVLIQVLLVSSFPFSLNIFIIKPH